MRSNVRSNFGDEGATQVPLAWACSEKVPASGPKLVHLQRLFGHWNLLCIFIPRVRSGFDDTYYTRQPFLALLLPVPCLECRFNFNCTVFQQTSPSVFLSLFSPYFLTCLNHTQTPFGCKFHPSSNFDGRRRAFSNLIIILIFVSAPYFFFFFAGLSY